jgi:hypothetical protein
VVALVVAATVRLIICIAVVEAPIQHLFAVTLDPVLQAVLPLSLNDWSMSVVFEALTEKANTAEELAVKLYVGSEVVP